jgi:hypothetical protein
MSVVNATVRGRSRRSGDVIGKPLCVRSDKREAFSGDSSRDINRYGSREAKPNWGTPIEGG